MLCVRCLKLRALRVHLSVRCVNPISGNLPGSQRLINPPHQPRAFVH